MEVTTIGIDIAKRIFQVHGGLPSDLLYPHKDLGQKLLGKKMFVIAFDQTRDYLGM
jgi:hypothetical protein